MILVENDNHYWLSYIEVDLIFLNFNIVCILVLFYCAMILYQILTSIFVIYFINFDM